MNAGQIFWLAVGAGVVALILFAWGGWIEYKAYQSLDQFKRDEAAFPFVLGAVLAIVSLVAGFIYWVLG